MNLFRRLSAVLVIAVMSLVMCSKDNSVNPKPEPFQGKISAVTPGVTGQNGNILAVMVYDADWAPGSNIPVVAGLLATITNDDFSLTQNLHPVDSQSPGGYSTEEKLFEPKTYSVVFFVAPPGSAPQHFTELRVTVNGNVTATAPGWANWTHF
jgi:hypothetical protein